MKVGFTDLRSLSTHTVLNNDTGFALVRDLQKIIAIVITFELVLRATIE